MSLSSLRAVVVLAAFAPTSALAFCSEPSKPYCIEGYGNFTDKYEAESCQSEVERFVENSRDYVQCLVTEQNESVEEANDVIKKFNCRIQGETIC